MPRPRNKTLAMIWRCARHQNPEVTPEFYCAGASEWYPATAEHLQPSDTGIEGAHREDTIWTAWA